MDMRAFETQVAGSVVDLAQYQKAEPIKSTQELKNEWRKQRLGKFTASEFHRLMAYPNKDDLPTGAQTYAAEKAIELLTEFQEEDPYISPDMQWGLDHELEAINVFTNITRRQVELIGDNQQFIALNDDIGCTPDGLVGKTQGIEIKCPRSITHFNYLRISHQDELKKLKPEYYWQIQGSLWITHRKTWFFVSYDPRFKHERHKINIVRVCRCPEDIKLLKRRLKMAVAHRDALLKALG